MVPTRLFLAVGFVLVSVWDSTAGLRCTMNCATIQCSPPRGRRCEPVFKPCECCPVCASDRGMKCGGIAAPCMRGLWCIHASATKLEAKRNPTWPDPFRGVCGRMFVHTRWHHYRRYHHMPRYWMHNKPHHQIHKKPYQPTDNKIHHPTDNKIHHPTDNKIHHPTNKIHHPIHNKHHREWRGKKVYIAK